MGARDEHAIDASANAQLSALRNWMMRPMGVSSSLLADIIAGALWLFVVGARGDVVHLVCEREVEVVRTYYAGS